MSVPVPHGVSPWQFEPGDRFTVTIVGLPFRDIDAVDLGPQITVERFTVENVTDENDGRIIAKIRIEETAAPGFRDLTISNPSGHGVLQNCFEVLKQPGVPVPHGVSPWQFEPGDRFTVTIVGLPFRNIDAVDLGPQITVERFAVENVNDENDGRIIAKIKIEETATPGSRDLTISNPSGHGVLQNCFKVQPYEKSG